MAPIARVLVLRHPETLANVQHRFVGSTDSPLSADGRRQASALIDRIVAWHPARVVSSPSERALVVARAAAHAVGVPLLVDAGLAECDFGEAEGLTFDEIAARGLALRAWPADAQPGARLTGESARQVRKRVERVAMQLAAAPGDTAVVTHAGVMRQLLMLWGDLGRDDAERVMLPSGAALEFCGEDGAMRSAPVAEA